MGAGAGAKAGVVFGLGAKACLLENAVGDTGDTPLHACATNRSLEAAFCATILSHRGGTAFVKKQTESQRDTCLHVAAANNNVRFIQGVQAGLSASDLTKLLALKNADAQTPLGAAKTRKCQEVVELLEGLRAKQSALYSVEDVDQSRIMKVWERFFENASRRMMGEELLTDEEDLEPSTRDVAIGEVDDCTSSDWVRVKAMWTNFVCYDKEGWFTVDKWTRERVWLSDFLRSNASVLLNAHQLSLIESRRGRNAAHFPTSITGACKEGWLPYFDHASNRSLWLNTRSWICEQALPIGRSTSCCNDLRLVTRSEGWVETDQICSTSGVQVIVGGREEEDEEEVVGGWKDEAEGVSSAWDWPVTKQEEPAQCYFINRISGHKAWHAPAGWCDSFPGWELCCEEGHMDQCWWYNRETGESYWCEPT